MSKNNILLIWDRMGDYHRARWKALQYKSTGTVIAADLFAYDDLYQWKSTKQTKNYLCFSVDPLTGERTNSFISRFNNFRRAIKENKVTTVFIPGYQHFIYLLFILYAKFHRVKVVLFAESWYRSNRVLELFKSLFLRCFVDHFFVSGQHACDHFADNLGIPKTKIVTGYSVVDNDHFHKAQSKYTPEQNILLCVARYATEKNLNMLVDAFITSDISNTWKLVLVGDGPGKEELQSLTQDHENVELTGWMTYDELPSLYHSSTCFILPSSFEPWGLVVNEAMSAGLPIILSNQCGCVPDLLNDKNGWSFESNDSDELIRILDELASKDKSSLETMGNESKKIIDRFSVNSWASTAISFV